MFWASNTGAFEFDHVLKFCSGAKDSLCFMGWRKKLGQYEAMWNWNLGALLLRGPKANSQVANNHHGSVAGPNSIHGSVAVANSLLGMLGFLRGRSQKSKSQQLPLLKFKLRMSEHEREWACCSYYVKLLMSGLVPWNPIKAKRSERNGGGLQGIGLETIVLHTRVLREN